LKIQEEGLKRVIGVRSLAVMIINNIIGAGIFALPAIIALRMGSSAYLTYIICGVLLMLVLLCFIEVGTKITTSGGPYTYVEKAFGPYAGFIINSLYWIGFGSMGMAALANVIVDNLSLFVPALHEPLYRILFLTVMIGGLAILNIIGAKESSRFVNAVSLFKIVPLVLFIVIGIFFIDPVNLNPDNNFTAADLGESALILFFAFGGGAESVLCATGEMKDPKRTIPRGLLLGVMVVFIVYFLIQLVAQGVLGASLPMQNETPLASVADKIVGGYGLMLMVAGAAFSSFGTLSGDILVSSRVPYSAARDGLLPAYLAKVHPTFATPYRSVILYALVIFLLSVSGGFKQLAVMSSAALLLIYMGVILSTIRLRNLKSENAYTIPGGITVPVLALIATGWFLSHLTREEIVAVALFLIFVTMVYFLMKRIIQKNSRRI
jgi:basic amino acid/polyamine antiporter, APA family